MNEYHKIQTVFLRDPATNFKTLLEGQYAEPAFDYLANCWWMFTEKVDGTNIRVMWDGERVTFGGKTNDAQIPVHLLARLTELFPSERLRSVFDCGDVCLYGEGFGAKIQKGGGRYKADGGDFILFDVKVGGVWLERPNVSDIAEKCGVPIVPIVRLGTLPEAIQMVRDGFKSTISADSGLNAEGLVMRPVVNLFDRLGRRIITKVKAKDFRR